VRPLTLFELAGREPVPARLAEATFILIDAQNEYVEGPLRLSGIDEAAAKATLLLGAARASGVRIIHIAHRGAAGGLFDRSARRGGFIAGLEPLGEEPVVEKIRPNGFSGTDLAERIGGPGTPILIAGFMTHNCVSSTARAALDLGYAITIAGDACATRDLPLGEDVIAAGVLQAAELAALADRHAAIATVRELMER
jgi:nicotinamidase-related amidase